LLQKSQIARRQHCADGGQDDGHEFTAASEFLYRNGQSLEWVILGDPRGGQRCGVVSEMVLAELAGIAAEIEQELGERRGAGSQIGRAARQLRRD
jgi:hypothetical protein